MPNIIRGICIVMFSFYVFINYWSMVYCIVVGTVVKVNNIVSFCGTHELTVALYILFCQDTVLARALLFLLLSCVLLFLFSAQLF